VSVSSGHKKERERERERERETWNERETELAREIAMLPSGLRQLIIGHDASFNV
jgi:hypothetical protein